MALLVGEGLDVERLHWIAACGVHRRDEAERDGWLGYGSHVTGSCQLSVLSCQLWAAEVGG
jgi:hypothetical protein